jgi:hypothetical protein
VAVRVGWCPRPLGQERRFRCGGIAVEVTGLKVERVRAALEREVDIAAVWPTCASYALVCELQIASDDGENPTRAFDGFGAPSIENSLPPWTPLATMPPRLPFHRARSAGRQIHDARRRDGSAWPCRRERQLRDLLRVDRRTAVPSSCWGRLRHDLHRFAHHAGLELGVARVGSDASIPAARPS